ncbi:hypothetical protein Lsan_1044 [Legionella santicrucis]|uniref:Uncharacterized protein n=1 Tax=Legionella santicrucis TaxID=45074 RepID=A0A0W0Z3B8_9GAMM|nr:hypothetical protein [Legionella santicrucis]KTD63611.1 hypothetical protein Lsan_1044 [Legionella santicrucis]
MTKEKSSMINLGLPENMAIQLENLNSDFLNHHFKAKSGLESVDWVIIFKEGILSLHKADSSHTEYTKVAEELVESRFSAYNQIKQISHIPLLLLELLHDNSQIAEQKFEKLTFIHDKLIEIHHQFPAHDKTSNHQLSILKQSIDFISQIMSKKPQWNIEGIIQLYSSYLSNISNSLEYNKEFVTKIQLSRFNDITQEWIDEQGLDLHATRAILVAAHGPRPGLIEFQYYIDLFAKIGIVDAENERVYNLEQLPQHFSLLTDKDLIQDFLAVSEKNKVIGTVFADDPKMMFSDVLAQKAPGVLHALPKPETNPLSLLGHSKSEKGICPMRTQNSEMNRFFSHPSSTVLSKIENQDCSSPVNTFTSYF